MRRLREMSDASSLILQFGPYKGATLAEVAMNNQPPRSVGVRGAMPTFEMLNRTQA